MQQFWENPKIAHLIFVLEMRTFNFRFEKHLIFHLIFTELSSPRCRLPDSGTLCPKKSQGGLKNGTFPVSFSVALYLGSGEVTFDSFETGGRISSGIPFFTRYTRSDRKHGRKLQVTEKLYEGQGRADLS